MKRISIYQISWQMRRSDEFRILDHKLFILADRGCDQRRLSVWWICRQERISEWRITCQSDHPFSSEIKLCKLQLFNFISLSWEKIIASIFHLRQPQLFTVLILFKSIFLKCSMKQYRGACSLTQFSSTSNRCIHIILNMVSSCQTCRPNDQPSVYAWSIG